MNDPVNHPSHYTAGSVECIDAIAAALVGLTGEEAYDTGAAIKYLWRWKKKNGIEDLRKARWYIDRLIAGMEPEKAEDSTSTDEQTIRQQIIAEQFKRYDEEFNRQVREYQQRGLL